MGMDVYGKKPHDKKGEYFRNNIWWWHPLWDYCEQVAPEIALKVTEAHYNSGDGLNAVDARQLAFKLHEELVSGRTKEAETVFKQVIESVEPVPCPRDLESHDSCSACSGTGKVKDPITFYHFEEENVKEFQEFLMTCGGFEIC